VDLITEDLLDAVVPDCPDTSIWVAPLSAAADKFEINDARRVAAFLAQIAHESNEMRATVENLNYRAATLMRVWPSRFPDLDKAQEYEKNPEKLANYVYASRLGNGDEDSGDGWSFRGRGLIQLTGRENYRAAAAALGLPLEDQPELLEKPEGAALSAAWFWKSHGLNALADDDNPDNDEKDFETISIKINGGRAGLDARKAYWHKARAALGLE
jgi:putative chitinase